MFSHASKRCSSTKSLNVVQVFRCGQDVFVLVQNIVFGGFAVHATRMVSPVCAMLSRVFAFRLTPVRMTTLTYQFNRGELGGVGRGV